MRRAGAESGLPLCRDGWPRRRSRSGVGRRRDWVQAPRADASAGAGARSAAAGRSMSRTGGSAAGAAAGARGGHRRAGDLGLGRATVRSPVRRVGRPGFGSARPPGARAPGRARPGVRRGRRRSPASGSGAGTGSGSGSGSGFSCLRPRLSARRRTRSADGSSMLDEWLFTPILSSFDELDDDVVVDAELPCQLVDPDLLRGQTQSVPVDPLGTSLACRPVDLGARQLAAQRPGERPRAGRRLEACRRAHPCAPAGCAADRHACRPWPAAIRLQSRRAVRATAADAGALGGGSLRFLSGGRSPPRHSPSLPCRPRRCLRGSSSASSVLGASSRTVRARSRRRRRPRPRRRARGVGGVDVHRRRLRSSASGVTPRRPRPRSCRSRLRPR